MEFPSASLDFLLETDAELHELGMEAELCAFAAEDRSQYRTNYIGSKQKLVAWIGEHTPKNAASAFDAFTGSSVVGYFYKTKGLGVTANDALRYAWHTVRANIEALSGYKKDIALFARASRASPPRRASGIFPRREDAARQSV